MALFAQIEAQVRQHGPQSAGQLAAALGISADALAPMLALLVKRGRLAPRPADLRLRKGVIPVIYYQLGPGERLHIHMQD